MIEIIPKEALEAFRQAQAISSNWDKSNRMQQQMKEAIQNDLYPAVKFWAEQIKESVCPAGYVQDQRVNALSQPSGNHTRGNYRLKFKHFVWYRIYPRSDNIDERICYAVALNTADQNLGFRAGIATFDNGFGSKKKEKAALQNIRELFKQEGWWHTLNIDTNEDVRIADLINQSLTHFNALPSYDEIYARLKDWLDDPIEMNRTPNSGTRQSELMRSPKPNDTAATPLPVNKILYGPPGTGKTYKTAELAVALCNGTAPSSREDTMAQYNKLVADKRIHFVTFHQSYGYEEFVEGLRPEIVDGQMAYRIKAGVLRQISDRARELRNDPSTANQSCVLVIDEINRGNISKIFGELITLIEPDKREGQINDPVVRLPYSGLSFSLPANVHIIGTMNTSDRSIALLDVALRRRFEFEELVPDSSRINPATVESIDLRELLDTINLRLESLLDRDHCIGHAFLMNVESLADLDFAFRHKIIPLLQEYFHHDWQNVTLVLNDDESSSTDGFLVKYSLPNIGSTQDLGYGTEKRFGYRINSAPFNATAFRNVYQSVG